MKKVYFLFLLVAFSIFTACEKDESLDPRPVIVPGQYVRLDITDKFFNLDNLEGVSFGGLLTTPGNNVKSFELFVRFTSGGDITTGPYVKIPLVIETFPFDLKISPQLLATTLNVPVTSFKDSDQFRFLGYSYDAAGKRTDYNNLAAVLKQEEGSKQAYKFYTKIFKQSSYNSEIAKNNFNNYQN